MRVRVCVWRAGDGNGERGPGANPGLHCFFGSPAAPSRPAGQQASSQRVQGALQYSTVLYATRQHHTHHTHDTHHIITVLHYSNFACFHSFDITFYFFAEPHHFAYGIFAQSQSQSQSQSGSAGACTFHLSPPPSPLPLPLHQQWRRQTPEQDK